MNKKDKERQEKQEEQKRWKAELQYLTIPSSWFCQKGFHNWSGWVYSNVKVFDKEKYLYTRKQQRKVCVRCNLDVRRYVD